MKNWSRKSAILCIAAASMGTSAASPPRPLALAAGGLWEVSRDATGHHSRRICLRDSGTLAMWEHRGNRCTRTTITTEGGRALIGYRCVNGDFGQSRLTLITPRTLRIETQGISGGLPYHYPLHARRLGNCRPR